MTFNIDDVPFNWVRRELRLTKPRQRGSNGKTVERIQEWLTINGIAVVIDGDFGPATEHAVGVFQRSKYVPVTGVVDEATFEALIKPLSTALAPPKTLAPTLAKQAAATAQLHLKQRPREVGGTNRGPWVRVYMEGHDGPGYLWCAGFACFIARQAAWHLGISPKLRPTFSCDVLAMDAKTDGRFLSERDITTGSSDLRSINPGCFFVQRRTSTDWNHTGVVISTGEQVIETIEGNTNEGGSREGYEVCRRIRNLRNKDFIRI